MHLTSLILFVLSADLVAGHFSGPVRRDSGARLSKRGDRLSQSRPPNEVSLKLKAKKDAMIFKTAPMSLNRQEGDLFSPGAIKKKDGDVINERHPKHISGQLDTPAHMADPDGNGAGSARIRGPQVRADVQTHGGIATVDVRDPSKQYHPSGQHSQVLDGHEKNIFRAQGLPNDPAQIKVKAAGRGSARLQGTQHSFQTKLDQTPIWE